MSSIGLLVWLAAMVGVACGCGASSSEAGALFGYGRIIPPDPPPEDPEDPDDPDQRRNPCTPRPMCPHKGGDAHHNACADTEPPNIHPGCDVKVRWKHFDALTPAGVLWEVKTEKWGTYSEWLRDKLLPAYALEAKAEHEIAISCGFPFTYGVADRALYEELQDLGVDAQVLRHIPRCERP